MLWTAQSVCIQEPYHPGHFQHSLLVNPKMCKLHVGEQVSPSEEYSSVSFRYVCHPSHLQFLLTLGFYLVQLVMEYCLGSASDLLEGKSSPLLPLAGICIFVSVHEKVGEVSVYTICIFSEMVLLFSFWIMTNIFVSASF